MQQIQPVAATLAVVTNARFVLLVRRRNPPDAGLWGFPGGKIRPNETIMAAARRELYEETGVFAAPCRITAPLEIFGDGEMEPFCHYILIPVLCQYLDGIPQANDDAMDAGWFHQDELASLRTFMSLDVERLAATAIAELDTSSP